MSQNRSVPDGGRVCGGAANLNGPRSWAATLAAALAAALLFGFVVLDVQVGHGAVGEAHPDHPPLVRMQLDTVGFALSWQDMESVVAASRDKENEAVVARRRELGLSPDMPWIAAVMPHDDYLYAGPVDLHLLPGLQAERWVIVGVCHACRRIGVRDRLIFDSYDSWVVAGVTFPVDSGLRGFADNTPDIAARGAKRQQRLHEEVD